MITNPQYKHAMVADKKTPMEEAALPIALKNIKKVYDAGIPVGLGTDSGATPIRPYGFSEHMELQLLARAGLTPLQAITVGTKNGARLLGAADEIGTLIPGHEASFIVLDKDPSANISNAETILAVWKAGKAGERRTASRDSTARGLRRIHRSVRPGQPTRLRCESRSVGSEMALRSAEVSMNSSGSGRFGSSSFRSASSGRGNSGPDCCNRCRAIFRVFALRSGCLRISRKSWWILRRAGEGIKAIGAPRIRLLFA